MSNLEITFIGICTHLWEDQNVPPNPAFGTRIVMPNASDPEVIRRFNERYQLNPPIVPHVVTLAFPLGQFVSKDGPIEFFPWIGSEGLVLFTLLDGAIVTVTSPTSTTLVKDARCMPGLGSFMPGVSPGLAATSMDATLASAYFDFKNGNLQGTALGWRGDAGAILYTTTCDTPEITITPFDLTEPATKVTLSGDPAQVYILNIPAPLLGDKDNSNDFVLHYLVASELPPTPWPPASPLLGIPCQPHPNGQEILQLLKINDDFGVGCSNSNLP